MRYALTGLTLIALDRPETALSPDCPPPSHDLARFSGAESLGLQTAHSCDVGGRGVHEPA
jgi:hypothetical protein